MDIRRILTIVIAIAVFSGIGYLAYFFIEESSKEKLDPAMAIPSDALVVLQSDDFFQAYRKLESTDIYNNLTQTIGLNETAILLEQIDSVFDRHGSLNGLITPTTLISWHFEGGKLNWCLATLSEIDAKKTLSELTPLVKVIGERDFGGVEIVDFQVRNKKLFSFQQKQLVVMSNSVTVIEQSVNALKNKAGIFFSEDFKSLQQTKGAEQQGMIYLQTESLSQLLNGLVGKEWFEMLNDKKKLSKMTGLDVVVRNNTWQLSGYSRPNKTGEVLADFSSNTEGIPASYWLIPDDAVYSITLGDTNLLDYFDRIGVTDNEEANYLSNIDQRYNVSIREAVRNTLGDELSLSGIPLNGEIQKVIFIKLNPLGSMNNIQFVAKQMLDSLPQNEDDIFEFVEPAIFGKLFGQVFEMEEVYGWERDGFLVLGESKEVVLKVQRSYKQENLLGYNGEIFSTFNNDLSDKYSFLLYMNPTTFATYKKDKLNKGIEQWIDDFEEKSNVNQVFVQLTKSSNGFMYNNIIIKSSSNKQSGGKRSEKWNYQMEAPLLAGPWIVRNHREAGNEILVQDTANVLYFINTNGELKWKKQLDGKILGNINEVDFFKNNKVQYLFNTSKYIHVLDINGNVVKGFPVQLQKESVQPIAVFDYDNDKDYRLLIDQGNSINNYDKEGKKVTGWEFKPKNNPPAKAPVFIRINNKDYIISYLKSGESIILNRKGEERVQGPKVNAMQRYLEKGVSIDATKWIWNDSSGVIYKTTFVGTKDTIVKDPLLNHFQLADVTQDGFSEYVLTSNNYVRVINKIGEELFRITLDESISSTYISDKGFIALKTVEGLVKLFDNRGFEIVSYNQSSYQDIVLGNLENNGSTQVILTDKQGNISVFLLN